MTRIVWDAPKDRLFESGLDRGVLYPATGNGVAWNGLVSLVESESGSEIKESFQDGVKTSSEVTPSDYSATLSAITYPTSFWTCEGVPLISKGLYADNQPKTVFGLSYRTMIDDPFGYRGYLLHLVYNAMAQAKDVSRDTLTGDPENALFEWDITALPVVVPKFRPTAHYILNTRGVGAYSLGTLEAILYGDAVKAPRLPSITEVITILGSSTGLYPSSETYASSVTYVGVN